MTKKTITQKEVEKLKARYHELKNISYRLSDLAVGTIQTKWLTCWCPTCKCRKGEKHGPYYYLLYPKREKQGMASIYLPKNIVPIMEKRIKNFKKFEYELREIMNIEYKLRKLEVEK